jgi:hypothetical protein
MTYSPYIPNDSIVAFMPEPKYEGGWQIGGNWTIYVLKRPADEQIKNTEEMLGWKWIEEKAQK